MNKLRSFFKKIYISKAGIFLSIFVQILSFLKQPRMIYGYYNTSNKKFCKYTRISDTVKLMEKKNIIIDDFVWIWHYSIIDGSYGVEIEEGTQIGAWVGIFTHSSHVAIRLYGRNYIFKDYTERIGYVRGPVHIGSFCFISAGSLILPGVKIGRGSIIKPYSVVGEDIPEFSIVEGNPAKVIGDARILDKRYFKKEEIMDTYIDQDYLKEWLKKRESNNGI